jgi:hypothetical protein
LWLGRGKVTIDGCNISGFTKPIVVEGVEALSIKNVNTIGGTTGIFFGANKTRPLDNFLVENCTADGAEEECLSFDTYGNNVSKNPCIAELSVISAEIYEGNTRMYCIARRVYGEHPNEYYEDYSFAGREDYLTNFYVYFSQLAGSHEGVVVKIIDAGIDETGEYVICDTQLDPSGLTLNDYKSVSIMWGFFNGIIRNNTIKNGKVTGLAMYCAFFNNTVDGNIVENCPINGSYLYKSTMLAKAVWNGANGNIIKNNRFDDGFKMKSLYGGAKGYNNTYLNNTGTLVYDNELNLTTDVA